MKIFYIVASRMPTEKAYGYQIAKMCEAFSLSGNEVELIFPKRKNHITSDIFNFYNVKRIFEVREVASFDALARLSFLGSFSFWISNFFYFQAVKKIGITKDSVVYTRSPEVSCIFANKGYKTVLEIHAVPKSKMFLFRKLISRASLIVAITEGLQKRLVDLGFPKEKLLVAPDAVDLNTFDLNLSLEEARKNLTLPESKKILGYFGNFMTMGEDKGLSLILEALKRLPEEVIFLAVGGKPEEVHVYQKLAQKLELEPRVILKERVSHARLAMYQKSCDILLMPFPDTEHYRYFMSPLKMFEYMAANRPIITTNLPSIREVLDENSAVIIPPGNSKKLAEAIQFLLSNKKEAEKLADNAYEKVKEYTWDKRVAKIVRHLI